MTHLQKRAAAVAVMAIALLLALILAFRASEPQFERPIPSGGYPEPSVSKQAREAAKPTVAPDRIILTWKGDPTSTQAVTWRTDTTVTSAFAQIALADPAPDVESKTGGTDPKKVGTFAARTEPLKTSINEANYHSVNFERLQPATRYMYRVGDGNVWSEWFQFDTADTTPQPFGFMYFGDAQTGIKTLWSRVIRGAYSDMPKARFIIHAGDLVNNGTSDVEWGEWHTAAGWINGMVPSVPTPGNHEYPNQLTAHWRPQFTLPENGPAGLEETCYYFDFQGTRIISLNSNEKIAVQVPWLENVLATRPASIRWTVITFHHPLYSTSPGRDNKLVRESWRPIFDKFAVDLVLQGHDHTYGRSGLMRENNVLSGTELRTARGTVYAVSVSGTKMYDLAKLPWATRSAANTQLYQLVWIDGGVLKYEARTARGDVYDAFELHKRPDGGNDLRDLKVAPQSPMVTPKWPESPPLPRSPTPQTELTSATATPPTQENRGDYGRGLVAAIILGTVAVGVIAAIRGAGRKRNDD